MAKLFNMQIAEDERAMLQALADDERLPAGAFVRRVIRQRYLARFGEVPPERIATKGARR